MDEKTSLEKSHSKSSNFKLTLICLFACIFVTALWAGLFFAGMDTMKMVGIITASVGAVGSILSLFLICKFTR